MRPFVTNWTCKAGEVDILVRDKTELVFVEVKTRRDSPLARRHILDNITERKKAKLRRLVDLYLQFRYPHQKHPPVRIDVVGVLLHPNSLKPVSIEHIKAAV